MCLCCSCHSGNKQVLSSCWFLFESLVESTNQIYNTFKKYQWLCIQIMYSIADGSWDWSIEWPMKVLSCYTVAQFVHFNITTSVCVIFCKLCYTTYGCSLRMLVNTQPLFLSPWSPLFCDCVESCSDLVTRWPKSSSSSSQWARQKRHFHNCPFLLSLLLSPCVSLSVLPFNMANQT